MKENMTTVPRVNIYVEKLKHNVHLMIEMCKKYNIEIMAVTKAVGAIKEIVDIFDECGVNILADSRLINLAKMTDRKQTKVLLRLPMISYASDAVRLADISLNSEIMTVRALNDAALKQNKTHKIILMIELGDLREGVLPRDVNAFVSEVLSMSNIDLVGVGTNLTCYGGVVPDESKLKTLGDIATEIENTFSIKLDIISGGNSSTLKLISDNKKIDSRINNLRIGEGIFLGTETSYGGRIEGFYNDVFILETEIIEVKEKNSLPDGTRSINSFGETTEIKDVGIHTRAIIALGRQDVNHLGLRPLDEGITILGASGDHTILDITKTKNKYKVGDTVSFNMNYSSLFGSMISTYINKRYIK